MSRTVKIKLDHMHIFESCVPIGDNDEPIRSEERVRSIELVLNGKWDHYTDEEVLSEIFEYITIHGQ